MEKSKNVSLKVSLIIDNLERAKFFNRFINTQDVEFIKITPDELKLGSTIDVIKATIAFITTFPHHFKRLKNTLEWVKGHPFKAILKYWLGYVTIHSRNTCGLNYCILWNGHQAFATGIDAFCKENSIKTRFLELGNISGKIFVDPLGVNARSSIYVQNSEIKNGYLTKQIITEWTEKYLKEESSKSVPSQVKQTSEVLKSIKCSDFDRIISQPYVFVPLQVSDDTQLLFNSDFNNLQLLRSVLKNDEYKKLTIVVKFHPGDSRDEISKVYAEISGNPRVLISQEPVVQLIQNADRIITINSTVGLQALLLDKPVQFLGRSIFATMTHWTAHQFVQFHLRNIDYFGTDCITKEQINEILFLD